MHVARFLVAKRLNFADTLGRLTMNIKFIVSGLVLAVVLGVGMTEGEKQLDSLKVVANAAAKMGCTCVFVAQRPIDQCVADFPEGFDLASPYVDEENGQVRSSIYGIELGAAQFNKGQGCSLQ